MEITGFKQSNKANFQPGRKSPVQYIVVHYTANRGDTAKNNIDYFARTETRTSAHYFVDEKEVWQSVRDEDTAWHCGAKTYKHPLCRNGSSIGVEMCIWDKAGKVRQGTVTKAAEVVRELMEQYNVPPERVLRHWDVTGKNCPLPMVENPSLWEDFKAKLKGDEEEMLDYPDWAKKTYQWYADMPEWARESVQKAVKRGLISTNADNSVSVLGMSLQTLVYLDRAGLLDK